MTTTTEDPNVVTDSRAAMLAMHATYVQGGFSTPEIERERAEKQIAEGGSIDWRTMQAEVDAEVRIRLDALAATASDPADPAGPAKPTPPTGDADRVDVTAILAHVDSGQALRDRIKALTADLKVHEDAIRKELGMATEGVDSAGNVVVRLPYRSRHGLDKKKVKAKLTPTDFADCSTVTNYRTLLYGANES